MDINTPIEFDIETVKKAIIRKFPLIIDCLKDIKFIEKYSGTANTNGKEIKYNKGFLNTLTFEEQVFAIAHECLHIAFDHIARMKENQLNRKIWNTATDAVINQALLHENLPMPNKVINMPDAFNKCADEIYDRLMKQYISERQNMKIHNSDISENPDNFETIDNTDFDESDIKDWLEKFGETNNNHDSWNEEKTNEEENKQEQNPSNHSQKDNAISQESSESNENNNLGKNLEENFTTKNQNKKNEISKKIMDEIKSQKEKSDMYVSSSGEQKGTFGYVDPTQSILNWKKILRKEFDEYIRMWSSRRATKENGYSSRIVSTHQYDKPRTEVLLDTSSSIDENLLKTFIKQLKPMLRDSELFVGCFDTKFYGFKEISSNKDIDNFIFEGRGGTNFNVAVHSFSDDDKINKIVFTDGECNLLPTSDTQKIKKLFWITFGNNSFNPCCGKVIYADKNQILKEVTTPSDPTM